MCPLLLFWLLTLSIEENFINKNVFVIKTVIIKNIINNANSLLHDKCD